jgi:hypothetical protein
MRSKEMRRLWYLSQPICSLLCKKLFPSDLVLIASRVENASIKDGQNIRSFALMSCPGPSNWPSMLELLCLFGKTLAG